MTLTKLFATAAISILSVATAIAQKAVHNTIISKNNEVMNVAPGPNYGMKFGDVIEVTKYEPKQTQYSKFPAGRSYNMFLLSQGAKRTPQAFLYFSTDRAYWQDALRSNTNLKIKGLGAEGQSNTLQAGDTYTIFAAQYKENGPIEISLVFTRQGKKVATLFTETKPMKWPGN